MTTTFHALQKEVDGPNGSTESSSSGEVWQVIS